AVRTTGRFGKKKFTAEIAEKRRRLLKKYSSARSARASQFPRLGVLPRDVSGVVEVQQQAFAAVEKSEADEVVVDECRQRTQNDVDEAEAVVALGDRQLRPQRRITVHVIEVESQGWVGVMDERILELLRLLRYVRFQFAAVVRVVAGDKSLPPAKQSQLGIGVEAAMTNPAAEKQILARDMVAACRVRAGDGGTNLFGQARTHLLVRIKQQ